MTIPAQDTRQGFNVVGSPLASATLNYVPPSGVNNNSYWYVFVNDVILDSGLWHVEYPTIHFTPPIAVDSLVVVGYEIPPQRTLDFANGEQFNATTVNHQLDQIVSFIQHPLWTRVSIAGDETQPQALPSKVLRANRGLMFDSSGNMTITDGNPNNYILFPVCISKFNITQVGSGGGGVMNGLIANGITLYGNNTIPSDGLYEIEIDGGSNNTGSLGNFQLKVNSEVMPNAKIPQYAENFSFRFIQNLNKNDIIDINCGYSVSPDAPSSNYEMNITIKRLH